MNNTNFFNHLMETIESLFLSFNIKKFLFVLFLVLLSIYTILSLEEAIGYIYFFRMSKKLDLLVRLNELAQSAIYLNPDLNAIYQDIVIELESYTIKQFSFSSLIKYYYSFIISLFSTAHFFWEFLSGSAFGFLVALAGITRRKKDSEWRSMFWGGICWGCLFGFSAFITPKSWNIFTDFLLLIIIQSAILYLISRRQKKQSL